MQSLKINVIRLLGFLCLCLNVVAISCTSKTKLKQTDLKSLKTISIDNSKIHSVSLIDSLVDSIQLIPLETKNECLVGKMDKVFCTKDRIIVVDEKNTKSIFFFSNQGRYLNKIAKKGKGKGEFISMHDVILTASGVEVFDDFLSKVIKYDIDGKFISEVALVPFSKSKFAKTGDAEYLFFNINEPTIFGSFKLYNWNADQKTLTAPFFSFDDQLAYCKRYELAVPFNNGYDQGKMTTKFIEQFNDTVFSFSGHNLKADYVFKFNVNPMPPNYSNDYLVTDKLLKAEQSNYARYAGGYCEMKKYILLYYSYDHSVAVFLYNHNKGVSMINTRYWGLNKYHLLLPYNWFKSEADNGMIVSYEPQELMAWLKEEKKKKQAVDDRFMQSVSQVKENDNPIILKINLK